MPQTFVWDFDKSVVSTIPWRLTTGTGTLALTSAAMEWCTAGQALKYTTSTVASEAAEIHMYMPLPTDDRYMRIQYRFAVMDENPSYIAFYLSWRDSANWIRVNLNHTYSANEWRWLNSAGSNVVFGTQDLQENPTQARWHEARIEVDWFSKKWGRSSVDNLDAPTDGQAIRESADTAGTNLVDLAIEVGNTGSPTAGVVIIDEIRYETY